MSATPARPSSANRRTAVLAAAAVAAALVGAVPARASAGSRWSVPLPASTADSTVAVSDGTVVVVRQESVLAFGASDGARRWTDTLDADMGPDRARVFAAAGAIVVATNSRYGPSMTSQAAAYDARDGRRRWKTAITRWSDVAVHGAHLVTNGTGKTSRRWVNGYRLSDGTEAWTARNASLDHTGPPVAQPARVLVTTHRTAAGSRTPEATGLALLDTADGTVGWSGAAHRLLRDVAPVDVGGELVAATEARSNATPVVGFAAGDGVVRWTHRPQQVRALAVRGGRVFTVSTSGKVVAFPRGRGGRIWRTQLTAATVQTAELLVVGDRLWVRAGDTLQALTVDGGEPVGAPVTGVRPGITADASTVYAVVGDRLHALPARA